MTVVTADEGYVIEWTLRGTNDRPDPAWGPPAAGKRFSIRGASILMLRDGKISATCSYWNLAAYLMEVGLIPARPDICPGR
jgi:steroid delta-isomerase-like uncharacterized protein